MRKNVFGRQFKRDANERKALFKNLLTSLVLEERIQTSEAKAKAIKGAADKLVTKAKKGGRTAYRLVEGELNQGRAVLKLIDQIAPRFANRQGGYTRIIKVGNRIADNSAEAVIEWVEKASVGVPTEVKNVKEKVAKKVETKKVEKKSSSAKVSEDKTKKKEAKKKEGKK